MNQKLKHYVDALFSNVPPSQRAEELKEEILANLSARFEDYRAAGETESLAFSHAVDSLGDISPLLDEVADDSEYLAMVEYYRNRNATCLAVSVGLYILAVAFVVIFGVIGEAIDQESLFGGIGVVLMLMVVAGATGLIVYSHQSTPPEYTRSAQKRDFSRFAQGSAPYTQSTVGHTQAGHSENTCTGTSAGGYTSENWRYQNQNNQTSTAASEEARRTRRAEKAKRKREMNEAYQAEKHLPFRQKSRNAQYKQFNDGVLLVYLLLSFTTTAWWLTWVIFFLADYYRDKIIDYIMQH